MDPRSSPPASLSRIQTLIEFYLVDDGKLDVFQNHSTVGGERVSDQLRQMRLEVGEASVVCDTKSSSDTNVLHCSHINQAAPGRRVDGLGWPRGDAFPPG